MKKNKNLFTGIILGMCVVIVPLILMGSTTSNDDGNGRYQISTTTFGMESNNIYETIIDTRTGRVTSREKWEYRDYSQKGSY